MKKTEIDKLDAIWAKKVKDKAGWKCEHCGVSGERMEAAHVAGRRYRATRWGMIVTWIRNMTVFQGYDLCGHCLCHPCHQNYDDHGPLEEAIVRKVIGQERKDCIQQEAQKLVAKVQVYEEIKETLENL